MTIYTVHCSEFDHNGVCVGGIPVGQGFPCPDSVSVCVRVCVCARFCSFLKGSLCHPEPIVILGL